MEIKWAELMTPNPCAFGHPFAWRFRLESFLPAPVPVDIGVVWVGSAKSSEHDIVLEELEVSAINPGVNEFSFEHPAPDVLQIPRDELFSTITVMTITLAVGGEPFARVAYLVQGGAFGQESDAIRSGQSQAPRIEGTPEQQREAILRVLGRNVQAQRPRLTVLNVENWAGWVYNQETGSWGKAANFMSFPHNQLQQQQQQQQFGDAEVDNGAGASASPGARFNSDGAVLQETHVNAKMNAAVMAD
jgi:hypothetical protein